MKDIAAIRKEYRLRELDESQVHTDPIAQFKGWFEEALQSQLPEPNAMHLSTVSADGRPSGRVILLKGLEDGGFSFYTNYQSHKGKELENNAYCCLTFFWPELERQVRIEGQAERLDPKISDQYFSSRPRGSRIGAWASPQSSVIADRKILEERFSAIEKRFEGKDAIERPKQWGGFMVVPHLIEFWQGRESRLHDRIEYHREETGWKIHRLAP
ncbi:MAG: pyridoxamine 5'-phosphate oxidase [Bacteroidetes bacterium]|nr:pyridoxamine 5'-phosphate oxidase [Bacteroidota bacterium]